MATTFIKDAVKVFIARENTVSDGHNGAYTNEDGSALVEAAVIRPSSSTVIAGIAVELPYVFAVTPVFLSSNGIVYVPFNAVTLLLASSTSPHAEITKLVVKAVPTPLNVAALKLVRKLASPAVREPVPEEPPILRPFFTIKSLLAILIIYGLVYR